MCRERKTVERKAVGVWLLCFEKVAAAASGQTRALKRDPRKVHWYLHVLLVPEAARQKPTTKPAK